MPINILIRKAAHRTSGLFANLRSCRRGVAAVEFALILPVLLLLLLGTTELTRALTNDRKVSQVASTVADLIAQATSLTSTEMDDIVTASGLILQPYSSDGLGIVASSVEFDADKNANVEWSCGYSTTAWADGAEPPITIPEALKIANTSVIIAVTSYTYTPLFTSIIEEDINLGETFFLRPRLVASIPDPGC